MIIVLLGLAGSGKGTQARFLTENQGFVHLSLGEIFRKEVSSNSERGQLIKSRIDAGEFVDDECVESVLIDFLNGHEKGSKFLFDGIPRTLSQLEILDRILISLEQNISHVFYIDVDREILLKRLSGRFMCASCQSIYNDYFKTPLRKGVCDVCESKNFIRRTDDQPLIIEKRLVDQEGFMKDVLENYRRRGVLRTLDGSRGIGLISHEMSRIVSNFC